MTKRSREALLEMLRKAEEALDNGIGVTDILHITTGIKFDEEGLAFKYFTSPEGFGRERIAESRRRLAEHDERVEDRRLGDLLRNRMHSMLKSKGIKRECSAVSDLGCTLDELKVWLSKSAEKNYGIEKFTWEADYSGSVWHIDHIIPLAAFDLQNHDQQRKAVHYTNLQLLTVKDNLLKGTK